VRGFRGICVGLAIVAAFCVGYAIGMAVSRQNARQVVEEANQQAKKAQDSASAWEAKANVAQERCKELDEQLNTSREELATLTTEHQQARETIARLRGALRDQICPVEVLEAELSSLSPEVREWAGSKSLPQLKESEAQLCKDLDALEGLISSLQQAGYEDKAAARRAEREGLLERLKAVRLFLASQGHVRPARIAVDRVKCRPRFDGEHSLADLGAKWIALSEPLSDVVLRDVDVLIVPHCGKGKSYSEPERDAVVRFVENGGGVLIAGITWSGVSYGGYVEAEYPPNQIAMLFGMTMTKLTAGEPVKFAPGPLTVGLSTMEAYECGVHSPTRITGDAEPLAWDRRGQIVYATAARGAGRVCVMPYNHLSDHALNLAPEYGVLVSRILAWLAAPHMMVDTVRTWAQVPAHKGIEGAPTEGPDTSQQLSEAEAAVRERMEEQERARAVGLLYEHLANCPVFWLDDDCELHPRKLSLAPTIDGVLVACRDAKFTRGHGVDLVLCPQGADVAITLVLDAREGASQLVVRDMEHCSGWHANVRRGLHTYSVRLAPDAPPRIAVDGRDAGWSAWRNPRLTKRYFLALHLKKDAAVLVGAIGPSRQEMP